MSKQYAIPSENSNSYQIGAEKLKCVCHWINVGLDNIEISLRSEQNMVVRQALNQVHSQLCCSKQYVLFNIDKFEKL